jgi:hypothetical protein
MSVVADSDLRFLVGEGQRGGLPMAEERPSTYAERLRVSPTTAPDRHGVAGLVQVRW